MPTSRGRRETTERDPLGDLADAYVRLVLAVHRHTPYYVDAYFGPPAWRSEARRGRPRLTKDLLAHARELLDKVRALPASERGNFLERQLVAVESFVRTLLGETLSWGETLRTILDAEPLRFQPDEVSRALARLGDLLPGRGSIAGRSRQFLRGFEIPRTRLKAVLDATVRVARLRSKNLFGLANGEAVRFRLVRGKPWAAYNYYLGRGKSIIDINLDHRQHPRGLLEKITHETYPGHHTLLSTRERLLVRGKGWREHAVAPLLSPLSVITEGAAYLALDVIMGEGEIREFIREVTAPMAGLSKTDLETYFEVTAARGIGEHQNDVIMEVARRFHEEAAPTRQVVAFMIDCGFSRQLAYSVIRFAKTYKAYTCTYRLGVHTVKSYLGTGPDKVARYREILCRPFTPSALRAARPASPGA